MSIFKVITSLFQPAAELVDALHTSTEEKLTIKAALLQTQASVISETLSYEGRILDAQKEVVLAETKSESWLTRNWRPITMLTFLVLVVLDQTGFLAFRLAEQAWGLLQLGIGGYVVGRSAEKVLPSLLSAMKDKEKS